MHFAESDPIGTFPDSKRSKLVFGFSAVRGSSLHGHLRALTEGFRKASKIVRVVRQENGLEAWRKLVRKFVPQNAEVHAAQLESIVSFGMRHAVKSLGDVPMILDHFRRVLDDYEEAAGESGINDSTKKTIMMQLLPASLKVATRDTLMAARQTFVGVSAEYFETIIVQRCEFVEVAMGTPTHTSRMSVDADAAQPAHTPPPTLVE